jgi:hypothetical protein
MQRARVRAGPDGKGGGGAREAALAVAAGNRHVVVVAVDGHQVEMAVAVEVPGMEAVRVRVLALLHDHGRLGREGEAAVAVTE